MSVSAIRTEFANAQASVFKNTETKIDEGLGWSMIDMVWNVRRHEQGDAFRALIDHILDFHGFAHDPVKGIRYDEEREIYASFLGYFFGARSNVIQARRRQMSKGAKYPLIEEAGPYEATVRVYPEIAIIFQAHNPPGEPLKFYHLDKGRKLVLSGSSKVGDRIYQAAKIMALMSMIDHQSRAAKEAA